MPAIPVNPNIPFTQQGNLISPNENPVYTRKSIGYADGYSQYFQKTGGHKPDGTEVREKITKSNNPKEHEKYVSPELMLDSHSNKFRRINGYGTTSTDSDYYEDPTYLIFDLRIRKGESPLFREDMILAFINEYAPNVPEIAERKGYWEEFIKRFFTIFPSDDNADGSGNKRHYIEAVGGLDVLLNPIINYPEDIITFTLTEDVAMNLQYLAELYNNLTYSYDTHRYLIPDNLLRFNMELTIRDVRNMKRPSNLLNGPGFTRDITDQVNESISKFIYVLHDCQFNFMKTRNFTAEIKRAGFGAPGVGISAGGNIDINFKSYSKITAPLLIDRSTVIDFRERETQSLSDTAKKDKYRTWKTGDYNSQEELIVKEKENSASRNITYRSAGANVTTNNQNGLLGGFQFPEINTDVRGFIKNQIAGEIIEVRNVIIKQIYEEVNQLIVAGQRFIGEKLGFTIGKVNVYYDSLGEKVTRFAWMFEDFLEKEIDKKLGRTDGVKSVKRIGNVYTPLVYAPGVTPLEQPYYPNQKSPEGTVDLSSTGHTNHEGAVYMATHPKIDMSKTGHTNHEGAVYMAGHHKIDMSTTGHTLKETELYMKTHHTIDMSTTGHTLKETELYMRTHHTVDLTSTAHPDAALDKIDLSSTPHPDSTSDRIYPDGQYNDKSPSGTVEPQGTYNQKFPSGRVEPDGTYNQKFPSGVVEPKGKPNDKHPSGDLNPDGKYNQKFPSGRVEPDGTYNEKYPEGVVEPQGTYNEKYPKGDLNPDGKYNQKFPKGSVQPEGKPNDKHPEGSVEPQGTYNEKFPKGVVQPEGKPNDKYPKGVVEPQGTYNEKYPKGVVELEGTYNEKHPSGSVESKGKFNDKFPSGSVEPKGTFNDKFPKGRVEPEGQYNQKFPQGTVESEGKLNDKYPEGTVQPEGKPNDKHPEGSVETKGKYNDNPPSGNIYGKSKPLPPTLKSGNVYKNK